MKYSILPALSLSLVLALPLHAGNKKAGGQAKSKPTPEQIFKKKDKDNDGFLSKDEFTAKAKDSSKAAERFARKDKNGDNKLSLAEFTARANKKKAAKAQAQKKAKAQGEY